MQTTIRPFTQTVFALCSRDTFTLAAGETEHVCVSFTPTENLLYEGLAEFTWTNPDGLLQTRNVRLTGSGGGSPFVNMDMYSFRATLSLWARSYAEA